jgi:type I restriction enzyme S subunit
MTDNQSTDECKMTELGLIPNEWGIIPFSKCLIRGSLRLPDSVQRNEYKTKGKYPIVDQSEKLIAGYTDEVENVFILESPIIIFGDHTRYLNL